MRIAYLLETTDRSTTDSHQRSQSLAPSSTENQELDIRALDPEKRPALTQTSSHQSLLQVKENQVPSIEPSGRICPQDKQPRSIYSLTGIRKRREWRLVCRKSLSKHIRERLGIQVAPSAVRLVNGGEDMPYAWHISDPSIKPLFEKPMSKHSVGAYIELHAKVGRSFWAIHPRDTRRGSEGSTDSHPHLEKSFQNPGLGTQDRSVEPTAHTQLRDLQADTARLLDRLEQAKARTHNQTWADTESQVEMIRSIVQDAETMIKMHQRLLPI
ncbi:hypothetical protein BDV59DRAFT_178144 [Aspergillus ambiguus]|uniref:uncharacterized protein n=1 Tax=Aspergillus ambiguus TaxID=176160 RepID=UPI003CCD4329